MKPSEAMKFLAYVSLSDSRPAGEIEARMWADYLPEWVTVPDALEALKAHRQAGPDWLMPSHIIERVKAIRQERLRNAPPMDIPPDLHQAVERQWMRAFTDAVKASHPDPNAAADEAMGITNRPALLPARADRVKAIEALAKSKAIPPERVTKAALTRRSRAAR